MRISWPFFLRRRGAGVHDDTEMREVIMYVFVSNLPDTGYWLISGLIDKNEHS